MSRNPDGTFKSGDPETRESARRGGTASGGSRQVQQRQAHRQQQSQIPAESGPNRIPEGKFQDNSERAREAGRKGGVAAQDARQSSPGGDEGDEERAARHR